MLKKKIKNRSFFFLISFLFLTSLLSIKTLKKVNTKDIRISGSELFSQNDVIKNSSLNFPIRLIFVKTNLLEKELKQNLSLKNVSVDRELFPFGLKVHINTRIPIAYGERVLNDEKILGFIDKDGIFINKQNVDKKTLKKLNIQVFGWNEKFTKILSDIFIALENYEFEIVKITFSPNGFLTVEEKDLKTIFLGFKPDLIFVDYLNICASQRFKGAVVNSYTYVKAIAEELRGLAVEVNVPIVSATQTTRSGYGSSDIDLTDTSESFGLPATADLMFALISTEELEEMNQIMVKQLKNRYNDPTMNKRFCVGIDRAKMRLYDVEESAQDNLVNSGQEAEILEKFKPKKTFQDLKYD